MEHLYWTFFHVHLHGPTRVFLKAHSSKWICQDRGVHIQTRAGVPHGLLQGCANFRSHRRERKNTQVLRSPSSGGAFSVFSFSFGSERRKRPFARICILKSGSGPLFLCLLAPLAWRLGLSLCSAVNMHDLQNNKGQVYPPLLGKWLCSPMKEPDGRFGWSAG